MANSRDYILEAIRERFGKNPTRVIATATVLWNGWEMDNEAWLVEMEDGRKDVYGTSHGGIYPQEPGFLDGKIEETRESLESLELMKRIATGEIPAPEPEPEPELNEHVSVKASRLGWDHPYAGVRED